MNEKLDLVLISDTNQTLQFQHDAKTQVLCDTETDLKPYEKLPSDSKRPR